MGTCINAKSSASDKIVLDIHKLRCLYNNGYKRIMQIMQVLGLLVGPTIIFVRNRMRSVLILSSAVSQSRQRTRRSMLSLRKELDNVSVIEEGQFYEAGIAD